MGRFKFDRRNRLIATIAISFLFFVTEITAGFYTHSLALVADAFHYLSDILGFVVALTALQVSEGLTPAPSGYTFGWQRATLLGAFFNGVFLLALGISILFQAIERFINISQIENPKLVLIIGCIGFALNVLVMSFLHEHGHDHGHDQRNAHSNSHSHSHSHGDEEHHTQISEEVIESHASARDSDRESLELSASLVISAIEASVAAAAHSHRDLGMMGAFLHVVGDAINNVGVIISALVIWRVKGEKKYYIDPAIGVFIAIMIFFTAIPLTKKSGRILMQTAPEEIDVKDVKEDIEMIPGVDSVHELHIWNLDQKRTVASAHIMVDYGFGGKWAAIERTISECFHAYGIHSVTLQRENAPPPTPPAVHSTAVDLERPPIKPKEIRVCQLLCNSSCSAKRCCR